MTEKRYRDGSPVLRDGGASLAEEPSGASVPGLVVDSALESGRDKTYRGNEEKPIGQVRGGTPAPGAPVGAFVATLVREADLAMASAALSKEGIKAWVTVPALRGPELMELSEYLGQPGLK